jgi:hypothetical protein
MTDATVIASLVAAGTLLQGGWGAVAFTGVFRDDTAWQTSLMTKKGLDAPAAAVRIARRRSRDTRMLLALWVLGLICDGAALVVTLTS